MYWKIILAASDITSHLKLQFSEPSYVNDVT